ELDWNIKRDHPIVDKLTGNRITTLTLRTFFFWKLVDNSCSHRIVDIRINLSDVLIAEMMVNIGVDILCNRHAANIIKNLFFGFLSSGKKRFMPLRLPFRNREKGMLEFESLGLYINKFLFSLIPKFAFRNRNSKHCIPSYLMTVGAF